MNAFGLNETDPTAARISEAAARGALSHALLLTGSGSGEAVARYAAAAFQCRQQDRPCGLCASCRKVLGDIHPDVITVRDEQHKNISVDIIRDIRSDAYIRPNEGSRKVYIFPDCTLLTDQDQNVLLKIVEEGPPYAAFVFCAENSAVVLQTLRSRCVELKLHPVARETAALGEHTETLCRAMGKGRRGAVSEAVIRLEKKKLTREELTALLAETRAVCAQALLAPYGSETAESYREIAAFLGKNLTKSQIMRTIELLHKYHGECAFNVGVGHVLGALAVELEGIL